MNWEKHGMVSRIAVVTGANRGIGFEICRQLAKKGVRVILTSRDEAKGRLAVARLREEGLEVNYQRLDVTDAENIRRFARKLEEDFGGADILVNNAGIMIEPRGGRALDSQVQTYRDTLETNVFGPLLMCQALAPAMRRKTTAASSAWRAAWALATWAAARPPTACPRPR